MVKKTVKSRKKVEISNHVLVPKHTKLTEKEKNKLLEKFNINFNKFPKILVTDAGITGLDAKVGDVIKIVRHSQTAGTVVFYRGVIND